jgi:hypothetical protein
LQNVEEDVAKFIVENPAVKDALVKAVSSAMKAKADGADENPVAHIASHLTATAKKSQPADKTRVSRLLSTEPSFPKGRAHKGAACRGLQLLTTDAQMDDIFDKLVGDGDDGGTPAGNEALLTYTKFVQAMHTNLITNLTEPEVRSEAQSGSTCSGRCSPCCHLPPAAAAAACYTWCHVFEARGRSSAFGAASSPFAMGTRRNPSARAKKSSSNDCTQCGDRTRNTHNICVDVPWLLQHVAAALLLPNMAGRKANSSSHCVTRPSCATWRYAPRGGSNTWPCDDVA